jgi:hypothetical protein
VKSSLTLVPISDKAAQEQEKILLSEAESPSDKKPLLRLVSPEIQADLIKDALAKKPKRKARKRTPAKTEEATQATPESAEAPVKKARKPYTRKPKASPAAAESADVLPAEPVVICDEKKAAVGALIQVLHRFCEKQSDDLYAMLQSVILELGDDAPLESASDEVLDFVSAEVEAEFEAQIEAVIAEVTQPESVADEPPAPMPTFTFNFIGDMFISEKNDPFTENEWTLFEEHVTSRWYDSPKDAMSALHQLMVNAGLNYACETKILTRVFGLGDYLFKKYAFSAVVGIYSEHQAHEDKALCEAQALRIQNQMVPDSQDVLQRLIAKHESDARLQIKPENPYTDKILKWFSVSCLLSLAYAMVSMAIETGYF